MHKTNYVEEFANKEEHSSVLTYHKQYNFLLKHENGKQVRGVFVPSEIFNTAVKCILISFLK